MDKCSCTSYHDYEKPNWGVCNRNERDMYTNMRMNNYPIGMTYVPWQKWRHIYEPDTALQKGTIFAELDKPFMGMRGGRK